MSLCIAAGGKLIALAATAFSLNWTHSVEKTVWSENWIVQGNALKVVEASVEGSGAGIELPETAVLRDGRWVYAPQLAPIEKSHSCGIWRDRLTLDPVHARYLPRSWRQGGRPSKNLGFATLRCRLSCQISQPL